MTVNSVEERILAAARYKLNMDEKVIQAGMFDQKSTGSERQQFLQSILAQDEGDDEEENEVPDDETINFMIARSDDELELFKQMDIERRKADGDKKRLVEECELPDWLTKVEEEMERWNDDEDDATILGRGSRQRKEVDYTDSLTEKEWLKAIDGDDIDFDDELEMEAQERKRKSKKRKKESDDESINSSTITKRKKGITDPKMKKQMTKIMKIVMKYEIDGRILSEPFMKLPSRRELPDYYEVIKKPLDIKKILTRIEEAKYIDFADLEKDFFQLCQNAQIYNEEASLIYEDSIVLQKIFSQAKQKVTETEDSDEEGKSIFKLFKKNLINSFF
jgi:SWI/SNF-related matrix-associated actin-dependent regulator of chromatin subfamily A protein 2/4